MIPALGTRLPEASIPVTTLSIVSTAIATRDYQDVHHDLRRAQQLGTPDIFMNILTSNGYVERYVAGWAGPGAVIDAIEIRLGTPNHPGDTMVMSGEVVAVDGARVTVKIAGVNARGTHVSGTVDLSFPGERA